MITITVITRSPEAVPDYLGFGARIVDQGHSSFGDHVLILESPTLHDAEWQAARLCSGLHGAGVVDDLAAWKAKWGYVSLASA
jgi:hypothetical protein